MEINKQLFEDVLSGKLKGKFVLRNGNTYFSADLYRNINKYNKARFTHPYIIGLGSYTPEGIFFIDNTTSKFDIIDFIPETNMKENELTIEIPEGKIIDWDESKKQNKIILKDKQITYNDICKKLLSEKSYFITSESTICPTFEKNKIFLSNCAFTQHQLECILAKNKLATVAVYLNDGWKPSESNFGYFICVCNKICEINIRDNYKFNNNVIFKSRELAQRAIEILGEETIKVSLKPLGF